MGDLHRAADPWVEREAQRLRRAGGAVVRLDGRELTEQPSLMAAFARPASPHRDVWVALEDGRLTASNTGADWPAAPLDR
ncbi:hypothetical protein [Actinoplanes philippinensis]|uniref:hypothetical protein n=1 Tax=Actinoplanes philippinensis TaxID=35752 RepID=UPI0033D5859E